jgi:predicted DCC family thiol-disulfide oxidoreductase YuxK
MAMGERKVCVGCAAGRGEGERRELATVTGWPEGAGEAAEHVRLTVYYNGDCAVCRVRVARYQQASERGSPLIGWCDVAEAPWALRRHQIDCDRARRRLHAVDAQGRLFGGAAAFARMWRILPGYRLLGLLISLPGLSLVVEGLYRVNLAVNPAYRDRDRPAGEARHA